MQKKLGIRKIGVIHTPYINTAPYQPVDEDTGDFSIVINPEYTEGLADLDTFRYIYVIYYIDRVNKDTSMVINPGWFPGKKIGLFASRSPARPNPIGISIVRIKKIVDNKIQTSGLDVFDGTPLLDIKPYVKDLDTKNDANYGWIDDLNSSKEHLWLHIKGIPHT